MNLQTKIPLTKAANPIDYSSQLLLLGSCFSEHIGGKLAYFKFQSIQNPFGILFHPLAIGNLIFRAVEKRAYTAEEVFYSNECWHCFDAHSELSDFSKEHLLEKLNAGLGQTLEQIRKATHIVITLGTAWAYRKKDSGQLVANCHKVSQKEFTKELLSTETILKSLENTVRMIRSVNKRTQVIFTISPVRHLKDGFTENQHSKAHLISAVQDVINSPFLGGGRGQVYFPSYEIMMDELRDYRFYEADMVHPNPLAIDYIWEKFTKAWLSEAALETMEKVAEIQKGLAHRPFHPYSEQHQKFLNSLGKKIAYLQQEHDFIAFKAPSSTREEPKK